MNLATILSQEATLPHFIARDKKQAIKMLAWHAAKLVPLPEKEIYHALSQRESAGCTAMGGGVCVPHGRFDHLKHLHALFARLDRPIEFGAADGRPVDLIILLLSPSGANTEHLKALATISRRLRDKEFCQTLRKAHDAKELHALLVAPRPDDTTTAA